jgi:hypothetical protein
MLKKILTILFFIFLLTGCGSQTEYITISGDSVNIIEDSIPVKVNDPSNVEALESEPEAVKIEIPISVNLKVPFVSQAPLRDWGMPYQEACEEASMISVSRYFNGGSLNAEDVNSELLALVDWEEENDYSIDVNVREVRDILLEYFGLEARLEYDVTIGRIKYELFQGNSIIIPTAGRMLGNPYFSGDGPIYHMLVIRGYDSRSFITNDVGTNTKGDGFKYKYQTIIDSIHDWDHTLARDGMTEDEMAMGEKVMIVISN